jgi:glutathione S-transferase
MVEPLLTYFDVRGRAEIVRLMLEESAVPYRERRVQMEEWSGLKPDLLFGQLPTFEEDGELILQSQAIYRHLARKHELYGKDEREHTRCDVVAESINEAQFQLMTWFWTPSFHEQRESWEKDPLPDRLARLQRLLEQNAGGDGFWVGGDLTLADLMAWHYLDCVRAFSVSALARAPKLLAFKQRIETRPRIAAYLASPRRPRTVTVHVAPFGGTPETS